MSISLRSTLKNTSLFSSFFVVCALTCFYLPMAFLPCVIVMFKDAWSPAATGNPEKHLVRGSLRSHWVKWLLCSHYDSHQEGKTLQGQELHVELTHICMMLSTIKAWFSTAWGISNFPKQFSGPKTSRENRDRKKRGRKKTPTYLQFSVLLARAGHIFKTHLQRGILIHLFQFQNPPCCIVPTMLQPLLCKSWQQLWTAQSAVDHCLPPIQLQIGLNH